MWNELSWLLLYFSIMSFTGKYELESQENYVEFLEAVGLLSAKTDHKVITEVQQDGDNFTWTQTTPGWSWSNTCTVGKECELLTMKREKFTAPVTLENGKISIQFPQYHFTSEIVEDKLVMTCVTPGEKGVTFIRVNKRI
uniref:Fatty acid binding protein 6 n=1 Tax=Neogobius melanostomus TaxID=47308 RepID=A0A8C6UX87_9GOBI